MKINKTMANARPFNAANSISLTRRLLILPFTSSLAKPCTIIAEDCTPTFPAIAAINGVKKNNTAFSLNESSKPPIIKKAPIPPINPKNNQGKRARVSCKIVSSASTS